ncbi:hypothetical protein [Agromyces salentinus]|uniref:hypothetical protein n=1 Tax=Agromyces salentinus TaxID=269421 RepID=UPI0012FB5B30|nr:hypothetical protein [Agromyces salentinus]
MTAVPALLTLLLVGCTASPAGADEPTAAASDPVDAIVSIPAPEFAPVPAPDQPLSEAQSEAERITQLELKWQGVLAQYPDAVRPEVAFEGYLTDEDEAAVLGACYEDADLSVVPSTPADTAGYSGLNYSASTEADLIAGWACNAAHSTKATTPPPNDDELGWVYDYLTSFYAPCLEANGITVESAPDRDAWIESWPEFGWFPSAAADQRFLDREMDAALHEACPDPGTYRLEHRERS